jgi:hypothetical protein
MGLTEETVLFIYNCCGHVLNGKRMLELGYQDVIDSPSISEKTGEEYYRNRGVEHYTIDLYDKRSPYQFDLTKPFPPTWKNWYDIITNTGTTEHVEPKSGQYQAFKNVHDCLKVGGLFISVLPCINTLKLYGAWEGHSNYFYSFEFVRMLAEENDYTIVALQVTSNHQVAFCLKKNSDNEFMKDKKKFLRYIDERMGVRYPYT